MSLPLRTSPRYAVLTRRRLVDYMRLRPNAEERGWVQAGANGFDDLTTKRPLSDQPACAQFREVAERAGQRQGLHNDHQRLDLQSLDEPHQVFSAGAGLRQDIVQQNQI